MMEAAPAQEVQPQAATAGAAEGDLTRQDREERDNRTLFIRNLPFNTVEADLRQIPEFQICSEIKLPVDRNTGHPRGFGFAEYATVDDCKKAIHQLKNSGIIELQGRELIIVQSSSSTRNPRGGGGGGYRGRGGGGGFRGGGAPRGGYRGGARGGYHGDTTNGTREND